MVNSADILNARILIVDDQEVNVLLLEQMLRGADPVTTSSIFLTTATDVASMGMLLGLATVLVK